MLNVIDRPEKLWQEVANLAKNSNVVSSELYDEDNEHYVLAYGPVAQRNPFQALLYSAQKQFNVSLLPIHDLDLFSDIPWPGKLICHFHWIHDKTYKCKTEAEAEAAVIYWEKLLNRIKKNGHKILWTVHNVMPHETIWVEQDKKIHQLMADYANAIHVMASDSEKLTRPYYNLDKRKIFLVSHPTYEGAQPDEISRADARIELKICEDEFVFLSFGAIMEYKGYDRLMQAYDKLRGTTKKKIRLIIAGLPTNKLVVEKIYKWSQNKDDVILDMTPVPAEKIQFYFRSADLAVCPYWQTMNSGAAMMAITFDIPVLGPDSGGFLDIANINCGITFENKNADSLYEKMKDLVENKKISSNDIRNAKKSLLPQNISKYFFQEIKKIFNNKY